MIDDRTIAILHDLVFRKERDICGIREKYSLSNRQISYAIQKINNLVLHKNETGIILSDKEVLIDKEGERFLQEYLINLEKGNDLFYDKQSRKLFILLKLVCSCDYLSLDDFVYMVHASKSTVLSDVKELRQEFLKDGFQIEYSREKGYYISGNESVIRSMLMQKVIHCLYEDNGETLLQKYIQQEIEQPFEETRKTIVAASHRFSIHFVENKLKEFTYCFHLLTERFIRCSVEDEKLIDIIDCDSKEYKFSEYLAQETAIQSQKNITYIYAWMLGLSMGNIEENTRDQTIIKQLGNRLIHRFEALSGIKFKNHSAIAQQLYEHLRPAYYRLLYKLPIVNPLKKRIKEEYGEMYSLVQEALQPLYPIFQHEVPDDEIAYLTVHFAASTYEEKEQKVYRKRSLILCPSGVGTSIILKRELEELFPDMEFILQDYKKEIVTENVQIVFSTAVSSRLLSINKPFIILSPIMNAKEKYQLISKVYDLLNDEELVDPTIEKVLVTIKKYVTSDQYRMIKKEICQKEKYLSKIVEEEGMRYPLLSEITSESLISLNIEAADWEEAVRKAAQPLIDKEKVTPNYVDDMIKTAKESGPYIVITKHVALPHARPEAGAKEIAISIATLKTPISFGNKENDPVLYIFGLSALDNQTHITAMAELAELLDQQEFYDTLKKAIHPREIMNYIKKFEKECHEI
ncbi:hypothetical protein BAU15_14290 [Enterococcus sp. JM4C]|uniref:BglG family transcription antiterminator n=1 Tax=Candidatus Enterococcus huntleyi TaxID=1857217 RepID=UPI00137A372A|nr:BglG family transcription antiterminator [Enterococcus sp. JM4C]KAF1298848.1 hypothetical protein BAU15_14290 [Enterococcus sp. JM4C]